MLPERDFMSKRAKELSAMSVSNIKADGLHAVGGVPGLCLQIIGESRSWILRIAVGTRIKPFKYSDEQVRRSTPACAGNIAGI